MFQSKVIGDITASGWISYSTGGFDILTSSPMNFLLAGNHNATGTGVSYRGSYGYYWSKSSYSTTNAYYLNFLSSRVVPRDYGYYTKAPGLTVRCVAL